MRVNVGIRSFHQGSIDSPHPGNLHWLICRASFLLMMGSSCCSLSGASLLAGESSLCFPSVLPEPMPSWRKGSSGSDPLASVACVFHFFLLQGSYLD